MNTFKRIILIVGVVVVSNWVNPATFVYATYEGRSSVQAHLGPIFKDDQSKPKGPTTGRPIDPDSPVIIMDFQNRTVLRGLKEVVVSVEGLNPAIEKDGLKAATLKADTELQLRGAGLEVLSREEFYKIRGATGLYLKVHVLKHDSAGYVYNVSLSLKEEAHLTRIAYLAPLATTWESDVSLGITPNISDIRATVKDLVDEFVDMYLAANPK
ncbi:MAG: hypothetical protein JSV60_09510 [Desulfobacterales bacterium]|nr:MAG: hypothetical protein JSV60_09510 [Desulfobacterales bacterium]